MGAFYGLDLDTTSPAFAALTDDASILAQWVLINLMTATGIYWSAPYTGIDGASFINASLTTVQLAAVPGQVEAALQDQRIASVDVTMQQTFVATGQQAIAYAVTVTPANPSLAPFSFTTTATAAVAAATTQGI